MNIEEYLKKETGLPVAEVAFTQPQKLPFVAFIDRTQEDGDDFHAQIIAHDLTVEFYAARIDAGNEKKIEAAFAKQAWKTTKDREWIAEEKMFVTIYTTNFTEKR
jgi:hypothetical protein